MLRTAFRNLWLQLRRIVVGPLGCVVALFALAILCQFTAAFFLSSPGRWFGIPQPPVPVGAVEVMISYPSNDVERNLQFDTEQSAEAIQQFYRTKLPARGWRYACTYPGAPPCGLQGTETYKELVEVYQWADAPEGQWARLVVTIKPEGTGATSSTSRRVLLSECCLHQLR